MPNECEHVYLQYERINHPIMDIIEFCPKCWTVKPKMKQGDA